MDDERDRWGDKVLGKNPPTAGETTCVILQSRYALASVIRRVLFNVVSKNTNPTDDSTWAYSIKFYSFCQPTR